MLNVIRPVRKIRSADGPKDYQYRINSLSRTGIPSHVAQALGHSERTLSKRIVKLFLLIIRPLLLHPLIVKLRRSSMMIVRQELTRTICVHLVQELPGQ